MTGAEFHGVDIDLLADYVGGALDGTPEAERVAALVAEDPAWREAFAVLAPEMAMVGALLGDLPVEPMPADVVARLDAAFAIVTTAEETGTATVEETGTATVADTATATAARPAHAVRETVLDLEKHRRKRGNNRWVRFAAPIGVAAGAAALLGYGLSQPQGASDKTADSAAAPAMGEAMVAALPATTESSGTDYSLGTLLGQGLKRTAEQPLSAPADAPGITASQTDGLARLRLPDALLECLNAIARENAGGLLAAKAVDYARFDGQPALVVRFTATNGEWVWASGADCGLPGGDADTLGQVPVR